MKGLVPGAFFLAKDPFDRIFYGGVYTVVHVGRVNVKATIKVRFAPNGPIYTQEHVVPLAHVERVVAPEEVQKIA